MILTNLDLDYNTGATAFSKFTYHFEVPVEGVAKEVVISDLREKYSTLESIAWNIASAIPHIQTDEDGAATASSLSLGKRFSIGNSQRLLLSLRAETDAFGSSESFDGDDEMGLSCSHTLKYRSSGIESAVCAVYHKDNKQERLLQLYDSVLALSWLSISERSADAIRKANAFRQGTVSGLVEYGYI